MGQMLQKTLFLSVISFMLPGVTNTVLQIWAWQRWHNIAKIEKNAAKVVDVLALPKSLLILYFVIVQNQEKLELYWNYDCWERVWIPFSLKMAV